MPVVSTGSITIIDVNDGADGLDGPALSILASKAGFTYEDGVAVPAVQAIAFSAFKQSITGSVLWNVSDGMTLDSDAGAFDITAYSFGIPAAGEGNTVYLDLSDFGALRLGSVSATAGGLTSFSNVLRVDKSTAAANATRNVFVGDWATANAYVVGDVVLKAGYGWSCIQNHVSSGSVMPPTYPTTSNAYWTAYALKGDQGVPGTRGTITTAAATAGVAWVDAEANTAISTAGGGTPLAGDVVTLYNSGASFSQTRVRTSGGAWAALAAFFGGDVLVDGTLGAVKLAAGSVTTTKLAAGAVQTDKLLVTGRGAALNDDPALSDPSAWTAGSVLFTTITDGVSGVNAARTTNTSGTAALISRRFSINAGKTYRIRTKLRSVGGNGTIYLVVALYDSSGANIARDGTYWYYPVSGVTPTASWVEYTGIFGAGQGGNVFPATARTMAVGLLFNYNGTTGFHEAQDLRIEEMAGSDLIVDGAITALKIAANTITAGQIAANTITAGQIAAGTISATELAAGAITTAKLLVTGRGKALNDDPTFQDASAWTFGSGSGSYALVTETTSPVGTKILRATNGVQFYARQFPILAGTQYKVSMWARMTSGTTGVMHLRLYCRDAGGALVNYVATALTPVIGTLETVIVPSAWTKYVGYVTAGAATVNGQLIVHVNWNTTGVTDVADCRVEEYIGADLIVDGAIVASKLAADSIAVGTAAIQNGAIVNAMLGDATIATAKIADGAITTAKITDAQITTAKIADANITTAKIANLAVTDAQINDLDATKITAGSIAAARIAAGSLDASVITAGTITTDRIVVGAVSAFASNSSTFSFVAKASALQHTSTDTLLTGGFTCSGTPYTVAALVTITLGNSVTVNQSLLSTIAYVDVYAALHIDGVFRRGTNLFNMTVAMAGSSPAGGRQIRVALPMTWRETSASYITAGVHTITCNSSCTYYNSAGTNITSPAVYSVSAVCVVQENKV